MEYETGMKKITNEYLLIYYYDRNNLKNLDTYCLYKQFIQKVQIFKFIKLENQNKIEIIG